MHELLIAGPFMPPTPAPSPGEQLTWGDVAYQSGVPFWALRFYAALGAAIAAGAVMFFVRYASHEIRRDPLCACTHRQSRHLMTLGLGGSCRDCGCPSFRER